MELKFKAGDVVVFVGTYDAEYPCQRYGKKMTVDKCWGHGDNPRYAVRESKFLVLESEIVTQEIYHSSLYQIMKETE